MSRFILGLIISGILFTSTVQEPVSTCQDVDTDACTLFRKAKPDICSDSSFSEAGCRRFCGNCPISCYSCPRPVRSMSNCTTTLCSINQTCMIKHFTANDGSEEFVLRCEDKKLCEGLLQGFYSVPVGRRNLQSSRSRQQEKRDVSLSLSCCNTDFCNRPTPMTTTTVTQTSPGPFPHGCNRDIVFVLSDSGSVGSTNFRHALDFVSRIIGELEIGPTMAQTALLTYSTHPQVGWYFDKFDNKADVLSAVNKVHYIGGVTHTYEALNTVRTQVLTQAHGDRPTAENVVLVLTDGQSNSHSTTINEANKLHQVCKHVISFVIGSGINANELNAIATDRNHVFDLRSYSSLSSILPQLMQLICNA